MGFCVLWLGGVAAWIAIEYYTRNARVSEVEILVRWHRRSWSRNVNENWRFFFQSCTEPPSSWCSTNSSFRHSDSSLYPDSLNQETSSVTGSTRVEFIIGSPTRRFKRSSVWPNPYFDSIDSGAMLPESLLTDEFSLRGGEALAECDSLECQSISNESWTLDSSRSTMGFRRESWYLVGPTLKPNNARRSMPDVSLIESLMLDYLHS